MLIILHLDNQLSRQVDAQLSALQAPRNLDIHLYKDESRSKRNMEKTSGDHAAGEKWIRRTSSQGFVHRDWRLGIVGWGSISD